MEKSYSASYAAAGVDITAGYKAVDLMKQHVARTMNEHCIGGLGGFGGLFELDCTDMPHPVLISGTDGVGTKLRIAQYMNKHDTVGIDCVAMCVNDVICAGAKPLVFLDYIACGKNVPERIAELVAGVAEGCVQAGCALVGGETAEMPGFYPEDEYDLAGFTVGVVEKSKIIDNTKMQAGDAVIALPSSGLHSNGYSLVRKVFDVENADLGQYYGELGCALRQYQRVYHLVHVPVKEGLQPVQRHVYPVIRHPALGKVVGAYALAAVAAAHHAAADGGLRALLFLEEMLVYAGLEHLHGLVLVLVLAALVLALDHYARGYMGDAYGGFRLVYVLPPRAA